MAPMPGRGRSRSSVYSLFKQGKECAWVILDKNAMERGESCLGVVQTLLVL
jgi:hypothetical protein